ncbi:MAG: hypothetical protein KC635_27490, partial [Myxococcales bacterium]|nr:hypothetical protein [Myxococcales bacterium]
ANIEKALRETTPLISQVHAHGDRRNFVSALVAPSPVETLEFGAKEGAVSKADVDAHTKALLANPTGRSAELEAAMAKVVALPAFQAAIKAAVARGNANLSQVEKVRKFAILDRDFSQEHGEMTPTMKLKRKQIEDLHRATFDRLYSEPGFGIEPTA